MSHNVSVQQLLRQLEQLSIRLSEIVKRDFFPLQQHQLFWKEDLKNWSIAECLEHLNLVAARQHKKIATQLNKAKKIKSVQKTMHKQHWWTIRKLNKLKLTDQNNVLSFLDSPSKYHPTLDINSPAHQVVQTFLEYQDNILQFIADAKVVQINSARISIAFWGLLNIDLGDFLSLLIYHNERHIVQAQRIHYHEQFPH